MRAKLSDEEHEKIRKYLMAEINHTRARQGALTSEYAKPLAMLILLETGARLMEILARPLQVNGVYWSEANGGIVFIKGSKGSYDRHNVPVSKLVFNCIADMGNKPLITYVCAQNLSKYFNKITFNLLGKSCNIHSLRHWYCMRAERLLGVKGAMAAVGHKSATTLMFYLREFEATDAMRMVFNNNNGSVNAKA